MVKLPVMLLAMISIGCKTRQYHNSAKILESNSVHEEVNQCPRCNIDPTWKVIAQGGFNKDRAKILDDILGSLINQAIIYQAEDDQGVFSYRMFVFKEDTPVFEFGYSPDSGSLIPGDILDERKNHIGRFSVSGFDFDNPSLARRLIDPSNPENSYFCTIRCECEWRDDDWNQQHRSMVPRTARFSTKVKSPAFERLKQECAYIKGPYLRNCRPAESEASCQ